jgi:hypothetical protein
MNLTEFTSIVTLKPSQRSYRQSSHLPTFIAYHEQFRLAIAHCVHGTETYSSFPSGCDNSLSSETTLTTCSQQLLHPFEAQLCCEYVDELVNHFLEVVLLIDGHNRDLSLGDVIGPQRPVRACTQPSTGLRS